MPRFLSALLALLLVAPALHAQTEGELRRVVLLNGDVLVGVVEDEAADPVVIRTRDGIEQRVPRAQVDVIAPLLGGRFFRLDPTRTRTVLAPTGRTLGRGRTRIGTLVYILPNATVGLTDRVDVSGTAAIAFGDGGVFVPVVGAKVGLVDTGSFAAAVGTNVGVSVGGGDSGVVVTPYAAVTVGGPLASVSLSATTFAGGSLDSGDFGTADGVLVAAGGELQVNNGLKVLLDVGVPLAEGSEGLGLLPGVRLFGDRYSVDVFGIVAIDGGVTGFAPLANFAFTF